MITSILCLELNQLPLKQFLVAFSYSQLKQNKHKGFKTPKTLRT